MLEQPLCSKYQVPSTKYDPPSSIRRPPSSVLRRPSSSVRPSTVLRRPSVRPSSVRRPSAVLRPPSSSVPPSVALRRPSVRRPTLTPALMIRRPLPACEDSLTVRRPFSSVRPCRRSVRRRAAPRKKYPGQRSRTAPVRGSGGPDCTSPGGGGLQQSAGKETHTQREDSPGMAGPLAVRFSRALRPCTRRVDLLSTVAVVPAPHAVACLALFRSEPTKRACSIFAVLVRTFRIVVFFCYHALEREAKLRAPGH